MDNDSIVVTPPSVFTDRNVFYWNDWFKRLGESKEGKTIQIKARKYIEQHCVQLDLETGLFVVNPLKNEKNVRVIRFLKDGTRKCSCSAFERDKVCPHFIAFLLQQQIWESEKK